MKNDFENLPACAVEYIKLIIKRMKWKKKVSQDVQAELIAHFEDALRDCKTNEEKEKAAKELIANFGDAELIATLARRAKKRCRPMWQKILICSLQILAILGLYIGICNIYLNWGKPNVSVNYVEWLNNYVRQGRNESLNSAPLIKQAAKLVVPMPEWLDDSNANSPDDFNELQMYKFENWLSQNQQAFDALKTALEKPVYWNIYESNETDMLKFNFVSVADYRKLAKALNWQIKYSAFKNNTEDAIHMTTELCDLGQKMEGNGVLIEQLVGIAIESMGHSALLDLLDKKTLTNEQLADTQNFLQQHYNENVIDMSGEKALIYDFIQRNFTDDGKGGGKPIRTGTGFAGKNTLEIIFRVLTFNLPDKKDIIRQMDDMYAMCQEAFNTANLDSMKEQLSIALNDSPILMKVDLPAFQKVGEVFWRTKMKKEALITTLAILRFQKETGKYPQTLDELLQAGYIKQIPFDIYRNGSLTYKRTDTNFILYSFGVDRDDDGGKVLTNKKGSPYLWSDDYDAVFWPAKR